MNYKKVLEKLGLIENVDFALTAESFEMLPKTRQVEQTISHPEVLEVLDVDGVTVLTPYQAAYDEVILVEEQYTPTAPTQEQIEQANKEVTVEECDIALLVEEYLADKTALRDFENDSINIVNNRIHTWDFKNIPQPTLDDLFLIVPNQKAKKEKQDRINAKLALGQITDKACNDAFMYIQGANVERELTSEQKTQMTTLFAPALQAIQVKRPGQLKAYINSITPDEVLITTEMKEDLLEILKVF